jgi:cytosolic carboxypeptidase protein 2/3
MINVDGVIYGNFRCDLVGFDLNRCWRRPIKELQPQIFAIKKEIEGLSEKGRLACCIDLHSHSKQLNIFSYCNRNDEMESRLFSLVLSKHCTLFHFPSCTFGLSKEKETTARAVIGSLIPN